MPWNQHADWNGAEFFIEGTTSNRQIVVCSGDNLSMPPLRGRINATIVTSTSAACLNLTNPTTETLWVEKVTANFTAAGSSVCTLSLGIVTVAGASTCTDISNAAIAASTLGGVVPFGITVESSNIMPVAWGAAEFLTGWMIANTTGAARTVVGNVSAFYVSAVTT